MKKTKKLLSAFMAGTMLLTSSFTAAFAAKTEHKGFDFTDGNISSFEQGVWTNGVHWSETAATDTQSGIYGRLSTDKSMRILANAFQGNDIKRNLRLGKTTALAISGNVINFKTAFALDNFNFSEMNFGAVFNYTTSDSVTVNSTGVQDGFIEIIPNASAQTGTLQILNSDISGVTLVPEEFYALDVYIDTENGAMDVYLNGNQIVSDAVFGDKDGTNPRIWVQNVGFCTAYEIDMLNRIEITMTDKADNCTNLYIDDLYLNTYDSMAETAVAPKLSFVDGSKLTLDEENSVYTYGMSDEEIKSNVKLEAGASVDINGDTIILNNADKSKYFYTKTNKKISLLEDDYNNVSGWWTEKSWWKRYNNTTISSNRVVAIVDQAGAYGKDAADKTMKMYFDAATTASYLSADGQTTVTEITDTKIIKRLDGTSYTDFASKVTDGDKIIFETSMLATDYNATRRFEVRGGSLSGGVFLEFRSDGTYGLVPQINSADKFAKTLGKYDLNKWYRISAVFTIGSYNWELYINGEKIDTPELKQYSGGNPVQFNADGSYANLISITNVPVVTTVADMLTSDTYFDDMEIYVGEYDNNGVASALTVSGYNKIGDKIYVGTSGAAVSDMKAALTTENTVKFVDTAFADVADDAVVTDEIYILEYASDGKTIHRYTVVPEDISVVSSGNTITVSGEGTYTFDTPGYTDDTPLYMVVALYDGDVLDSLNSKVVTCADLQSVSVSAADAAGKTVKVFLWNKATLEPVNEIIKMQIK